VNDRASLGLGADLDLDLPPLMLRFVL